MKKTFKCICKDHLLEIHYENNIEWTHVKTNKKHKENIPTLWFGIYEIHGGKSGRKLKKPKLIADFELMGSEAFGKEMDFGMKFLEDIVMAYLMRSNK